MTTKITEQNISNLANIGVQWQSVFTGDGSTGLTAVAGRGYFIDTTSGTVTVTLPASPSAGDVVVLKDYARTWNTNNVTTASALFDGGASISQTFSTNGQTVTLVYMDGTKGWSLVNEDTTSNLGPEYITATGGTLTTSGDYKVHVFTGDGCFVVSDAGNSGGSNSVEYLVVAGGGGGGGPQGGGGGGAGGFRFASPSLSPLCYPAKPLDAGSNIPVSATTYPVTVGGGGATGAVGGGGGGCCSQEGSPGNNSIFSTITSAGGGGGGVGQSDRGPEAQGQNGGSGGGGGGRANCGGCASPATGALGGTGNTPPVSPPQGNSGGKSRTTGSPPVDDRGGGGGGALAIGGSGGGSTSPAGPGGIGGGLPNAFGTTGESSGGFYYYAGGGGGGLDAGTGTNGTGGTGGGADGIDTSTPGSNATANTGGGGGGAGSSHPLGGTNGGKGIVVIRYKFQ